MSLEIPTDYVRPEEKATLLQEIERPGPGSRGIHRWQIIRVPRTSGIEKLSVFTGGKLLTHQFEHIAIYERDMGPADLFDAGPFNIVGGQIDRQTGRSNCWHTVSELQGYADEMRDQGQEQWAEEAGATLTPQPPEFWLDAMESGRDRALREARGIKTYGPRRFDK